MRCEARQEADRKKGKVWLVGAGPSDIGLMTVKGKYLLERADVIVYDRLAGQGALTLGNPGARYIDVGKTAGRHPVPQQEIHRILVEEARKGNRVVRLKGGDPFVFGRGAEEALELEKAGIPFEIVPGITAATAVPAYQGIPVTCRNKASSLHLVTAHKKDGSFPDIPYGALAESGGTLVFFMGVHTLPRIQEGMRKAGMKDETPAAVLERGTTAGQRKILGTLKDIAEKAKEAKVQSPALILVGETAGMRELEWYDRRPLAGKKILLTRPREVSGELAAMLREKGAEVLEAPSIRIVPSREAGELAGALAEKPGYDWLVFTSRNGVRIFRDSLRQARVDIRTLAGVKVAAIGPGTGSALEEAGIWPDLMPEIYDGGHLGMALKEAVKTGERVLLPRARKGSPEVTAPLLKIPGVEIREIPVYDTVYETCPFLDIRKEIEEKITDYVLFTSASTVRGFVKTAEGMDFSLVTALCIGKQTAEAAAGYRMQVRTAREATPRALVELAEETAAEETGALK